MNDSTEESVKVKTVIESDLWNWIRIRFGMRTSPPKLPRTYIVPVYIEHPEIPNHVHKQLITIAAHNRNHARRRLKEELRLRIGSARLYH